MKKITIALLVLCLAMLACSLEPTAGTAADVLPTKLIPAPTPPIAPVSTATPITPGTCTVTAQSLHIRNAPTVDGIVIGWLFAGDVAKIEGTAGAWYQVKTARGAGFVHSHYCEVTR